MEIKTFSSTIRRKEMDAVLTCMVEEKIGPGELNTRLIQKTKELFSLSGAIALRSPAIALKYALRAIDLPLESGIILSALAPSWQYTTVCELGYKPIIIDVSLENALVTIEAVQEGIQKGGRLLLLHETLGQVPNFPTLLELNIPIIEDVSQNAGATFEEKTVGKFGTYAILGLEQHDVITAGGGALLIAGQNRNWAVLKNLIDSIPKTDLLPDINAALGFIQMKEYTRNEDIRKQLFENYIRSLMQGKHKTFVSQTDVAVSTVHSFPVVLSGSFKDVKQYASKKGIEICLAFEEAITTIFSDDCAHCPNANALSLRCALFPLYPRLGGSKAEKIVKVLATLP